jgi:GNAT superfamily N-acetyltransferase
MQLKTNGVSIVTTKAELKEFIEFPYALYKNHSHWVPPLRILQKDLLNQEKNPFFRNAEMAMFLAESNGKLAGRIAAIHNRTYNEFTGTNSGFFGFFECDDNQKVANLLFKVAEDWLRGKNVENIYGPMSPNMMGEIGVLIEGFDMKPLFMMPYNYPYYDKLISNAGYVKQVDLVAYYITSVYDGIPRANKAENLVLRRYPTLSVRKLDLKRWKHEMGPIREIFNAAWAANWGFAPLSKDEFAYLVTDLRYILNPALAIIVEDQGRPVAFSIGLPDINTLIADLDGKLFPFGWYKLLAGLKKIQTMRLALVGIIPEYQGKGIDALMSLHTVRNGTAVGYNSAEFSWLLETNTPVINVAERFGATFTKRYRMYKKQ